MTTERRVVTVLCADLVDFTALSARVATEHSLALLRGDRLDAPSAELFDSWLCVLDAHADGRTPVLVVEDIHVASRRDDPGRPPRDHPVEATVGGRGGRAGGGGWVVAGAWPVNGTAIVLGLVVGILGLVVCTPAMVGLVARAGPRLPLAPRVALRTTARNRSAAAPAVSAVMAAVLVSLAVGVVVASTVQQAGTPTGPPPDQATCS